jgi:hypothetical protein
MGALMHSGNMQLKLLDVSTNSKAAVGLLEVIHSRCCHVGNGLYMPVWHFIPLCIAK